MTALVSKAWQMVGLAVAVCAAGGAQAAGYPERTITMIVPAAAGGTTDLAARMAAHEQNLVPQHFQIGNGLGDRGLRDVQRMRGPRSTAVLGGRHEILQLAQADIYQNC